MHALEFLVAGVLAQDVRSHEFHDLVSLSGPLDFVVAH